MFQSHKYFERYKNQQIPLKLWLPVLFREEASLWTIESWILRTCPVPSLPLYPQECLQRREWIAVFRAPPAVQRCRRENGAGFWRMRSLGERSENHLFHFWKGPQRWLVQSHLLQVGKLRPKEVKCLIFINIVVKSFKGEEAGFPGLCLPNTGNWTWNSSPLPLKKFRSSYK